MLKVYTAGGFHGDWRQKLNETLKGKFTVLDPLTKEVNEKGERKNKSFEEYTAWDLHKIRECDILFFYHEKSNPGTGSHVEAGYAKGLGKTVIIVREEGNEHIKDRYLSFVDCVGDFVTNDLQEGINFLLSLSNHD